MVLIQEYPDISGHIQTGYPDIHWISGYPTSGYPDTRTNPDKSRQIQTVSAALPGRGVHGFTEPARTSKERAKSQERAKTESDPPLPPPLVSLRV